MGKLSGTVLILAGVALAGYTLSSQRDAGSETATVQAAGSARAPAALPDAGEPGGPPAVSPAEPQPEQAPEQATSQPEGTGAPPTLAPAPPAPAQWPGAPPPVRVAEAPPRVPVGETGAAGGPALDRAALTRQIQRELKRIGCYRGDVSGVWTTSVRQAMKTFTDRVNASLPVAGPDPVLLAMAQSQAPGICSASCPPGQGLAADGRCLPSALVAGAGKRPPAAQAKAARPEAPAAPASPQPAFPPAEGRMSLAGPPTGVPRQIGTPAPVPRWRAPARQARGATWSYRSAHTRVRQRAVQRPSYGFSGFLGLGLPF